MLRTFICGDGGAVSVDWVVLTAGLTGVGLAVVSQVSSGVEGSSQAVEAELKRDDIISTKFGTEIPEYVMGASMGADAFASMMAIYANMNPETLQSMYASTWDLAQGQIDDGTIIAYADDPFAANSFGDNLYAMEQALIVNGGAVPEGYPEFETAWVNLTSV